MHRQCAGTVAKGGHSKQRRESRLVELDENDDPAKKSQGTHRNSNVVSATHDLSMMPTLARQDGNSGGVSGLYLRLIIANVNVGYCR
jgi:hypothetical protein